MNHVVSFTIVAPLFIPVHWGRGRPRLVDDGDHTEWMVTINSMDEDENNKEDAADDDVDDGDYDKIIKMLRIRSV